ISAGHEDVRCAAGDEGGEEVRFVDARQRDTPSVHACVGPRVETERASARLGPEGQELVRRENAATSGLAPCDALELAELFEGIDADVGIGADAQRDGAGADSLGGEEAVPEI